VDFASDGAFGATTAAPSLALVQAMARIMSVVVRRNAIPDSQRNKAEELDGMLRVCGTTMVATRLDSLAGRSQN